MKIKHIFLCIALAALFMLGTFRTGCRIILNGTVMPGIYPLATVQQCAKMALRTAEEITRGSVTCPYTLVPVLCLKQDATDETLLYHVLLESFEGVEKLYAVSADGVPVGLVSDIGDIIALRRLYPERTVTFTQTYSYAGAESSMAQVRAAMAVKDFT